MGTRAKCQSNYCEQNRVKSILYIKLASTDNTLRVANLFYCKENVRAFLRFKYLV